MNEKTSAILESLFKSYYIKNKQRIFEPPKLKNREFAFQTFKSEGMIRHLAFENIEELRKYIVKTVPKHAFYSTAIYVLPSAHDMDEKGWISAELVFDIDADHLDTACRNQHDFWKCLTCGHRGKGKPPEICPNCGSKNIKSYAWICEKCLAKAKEETLKLIENFLVPDFGINPREIMVVFTGHRGFHIHVSSKEYVKLSSEERREIIDYIKALGLSIDKLIPSRKRSREILGLDVDEPGWRGKIARKLYDFLIELEERKDEIKDILGEKTVGELIEKLNKIVVEIMDKPPKWTTLYKTLGRRKLKTLLEKLVKEEKCEVDEKVTIDTRRLIRLPGTLHGKSGLPAIILDLDELDEFMLTRDLSPFKGEAKVKFIEEIPKNMEVLGEKIVGRKGESKKISLLAAIYLAGKGLVEIEGIK